MLDAQQRESVVEALLEDLVGPAQGRALHALDPRTWLGVAVISAAAAAAGYGLLGGPSPAMVAIVQAFAAGAILTMLADTMMPEGYEHAGNSAGLAACAGFIAASLLSRAG